MIPARFSRPRGVRFIVGAICFIALFSSRPLQDSSDPNRNKTICCPTNQTLAIAMNENTKTDADLEVMIRNAIDQAVSPEMIGMYVSIPPAIDTGTEYGSLALKRLGLMTDDETTEVLRASTRFILWVLVKGKDRPVIGIYWDQQKSPHLFVGWLTS
jgi:hypothetical protein